MEESRRTLAGLSEQEREEAMERFRVLKPAVEDGVPLARAAREAGVPLRTAQRWMASYKREGLAGLARRPRDDRGGCRGLPEGLEKLIEGLALKKPRRSVAAIHRQAVEAARHRGWPEPAYSNTRVLPGTTPRRLTPLLLLPRHQVP